MNTEASDPIDAAIDATEPAPAPRFLVHDVTLSSGKRIRLQVPIEFGSDEFESCVAMLMELRVHSEKLRAERSGALLVPDRPALLGPDGAPMRGAIPFRKASPPLDVEAAYRQAFIDGWDASDTGMYDDRDHMLAALDPTP